METLRSGEASPGSRAKKRGGPKAPQVTYHTRMRLDERTAKLFEAYGEWFGLALRQFHRLLDLGVDLLEAKRAFIRKGWTARQFNSIRFEVEGKRASLAACRKLEIADKKRRITAIGKRLAKPSGRGGYLPFEAHQKRRKLARLKADLERLERRPPALVFGSRRLWKARHHLKENGYAGHDEWLQDWRRSRSGEFFLVGSKDETLGNQSCQWDPIQKSLTVRLPDALGGRIRIENVRFPHGEEGLVDALLREEAVSFRFVRKKKGWYLFASMKPPVVEGVTDLARGALGVDVGPGLLAVVETDAQGNPVARKTYSLPLYRKSKAQARALTQAAAVNVGDWARRTGKPVSIERLDFSAKKAELKERGKGYARMLSGFAYEKTLSAIRSRCAKDGVQIVQVNPAYSSRIGVVKFASMYGLSGDEAAALVLARRAQRYSESVPARTAFRRPEDRRKHVWSLWNRFGKAPRQGWRHAYIAARRGPGGRRGYPSFPARAAPA